MAQKQMTKHELAVRTMNQFHCEDTAKSLAAVLPLFEGTRHETPIRDAIEALVAYAELDPSAGCTVVTAIDASDDNDDDDEEVFTPSEAS